MKKILFATENQSKAKRFKNGLLKNDIEIITINDLEKKVNIEENGNNAIENALIKARAYANVYNYPVLAMDDNLYIEGIPEDKQPGMYVRRVNGKRLNDEEMIEHYTNLAKTYGKNGKLTCRWVYGMALINNGKEFTYTWSKEDFYGDLDIYEVNTIELINPYLYEVIEKIIGGNTNSLEELFSYKVECVNEKEKNITYYVDLFQREFSFELIDTLDLDIYNKVSEFLGLNKLKNKEINLVCNLVKS